MQEDLKLNDGTDIHITSINQEKTYAGLLEGSPNSNMNERIISDALKKSDEANGTNRTVVIPPRLENLEDASSPHKRLYEKFYKKKVRLEAMPRILCCATLESYNYAKDSNEDCSSLHVIWFQENFAFPIEEAVIEEIKKLKWSELAYDWSW